MTPKKPPCYDAWTKHFQNDPGYNKGLARLTRQELKKDELATRLATVQEFFLQNQQQIVKSSAIAALAAVVIIGGILLVRSRQSRAASAFAAALVTYHAPVLDATPPPGMGLHFKTDSDKIQQALKQFTEVASRYSWTGQGKFARYYVGLCQRDLGKIPEAEKELNALAGGSDHELASLAKLALAGMYEESGRNDEAEKLYRDLSNHPTNTVPKATAELALADLYKRIKPVQATALYQQIQKEYSGLAAGDQASKMLEAPAQ